MTVAIACQAEVPAVYRAVFCLLHCTQHDVVDKIEIGRFFRLRQGVLQHRTVQLPGMFDVYSHTLHECHKVGKLLFVRLVVYTVHKRIVAIFRIRSNAFVGNYHKLFD